MEIIDWKYIEMSISQNVKIFFEHCQFEGINDVFAWKEELSKGHCNRLFSVCDCKMLKILSDMTVVYLFPNRQDLLSW